MSDLRDEFDERAAAIVVNLALEPAPLRRDDHGWPTCALCDGDAPAGLEHGVRHRDGCPWKAAVDLMAEQAR